MAIALPTSPGLSARSTIAAEYGLAVDYTDDGAQRSRELYGAQYYRITLVWEALLPAERASLEAWWRRYRSSQIEVALAGEVYLGAMISPPEISWQSATRTTMQVVVRAIKIADPIADIIAAYSQASVWYDPSDLSTMWQDTAGTIPAIVGYPVARIDDKGNLGLNATQATAANRPAEASAHSPSFRRREWSRSTVLPAPPPRLRHCRKF